jgi:hypothetical protein
MRSTKTILIFLLLIVIVVLLALAIYALSHWFVSGYSIAHAAGQPIAVYLPVVEHGCEPPSFRNGEHCSILIPPVMRTPTPGPGG